ncbi:MAG: glutamine synthetase [Bordetella sp. SCN 67-23]|nr:glutamine synthetase [Burkholderiales bacterium]ODS70962.1 MAG: glutamine synthetase [Bordetella sp. SCN 67-23]ODU81235.1 MAG: glutamine synthetase [Bordetella sp. SCN 68-11]OJW90236.1 MAG: glutamine synthetase [Burkholderiales bacterium 67-32]
MSFVDRFGLWSEAQQQAARDVIAALEGGKLDVVRFSFPDQHGILRGKTLVAQEAVRALKSGVTITTTMYAKDTSHRTVFPVFTSGGGFSRPEMQGAADVLMVADPTTFKVLPWAPNTGWLLCDTYFQSGVPVPFDTRQLFRRTLANLNEAGYGLVTGLEVECHVFKVAQHHMRPEDAGQPGQPGVPPDVELMSHGYQYLTELRYDAVDSVMELVRKTTQQLDLPLRSLEVEFGPSQFEFTFAPGDALKTADDMILFRNAVKQVCRREGFHATFMCRPRIPNVVSSGWHLHQSLRRLADGSNAFMPTEAGQDLSPVGRHYLGGLLAHACGATALSTPTLNGYKRYRPYSLAPDRAIWGRDNRGVMLRVLGGAGDSATRIENRVGEPAANPYLYFASQVLSGMDGIARGLDPGPSADAPYETQAASLPHTLTEALGCLREDAVLSEGLGAGFVDYFCHIKEAEIARFNLEVSEWEQREYFELF